MTISPSSRRAFITFCLLCGLGTLPAAAQPAYAAALRSALLQAPVPNDSVRISERWIARDKALHAGVSGLLTLSGQYVFQVKASRSRDAALVTSLSLTAGIGLAKEWIDWRYRTGLFSWRDLVADAAGMGVATAIILL